MVRKRILSIEIELIRDLLIPRFPCEARSLACEGVALAKTQEGVYPPKLLAKVDAGFRLGVVFS